MNIDCSPEERDVLVSLLESRIREMHPTIRRSRNYQVHDELKHDLEVLEHLLGRLQATVVGAVS